MMFDATGSRVRLVHTSDPYTDLRPGDEGEVRFIDAMGTLHCKWDNGSSLGLIPCQDAWEIIPRKEDTDAVA